MNTLYKIISITPTINIQANGTPIEAYEVKFQTVNGIEGKIIVPLKEFSRENVGLQVQGLAQTLEDTLQL